jgi:Pectate lyase superfamily protein
VPHVRPSVRGTKKIGRSPDHCVWAAGRREFPHLLNVRYSWRVSSVSERGNVSRERVAPQIAPRGDSLELRPPPPSTSKRQTLLLFVILSCLFAWETPAGHSQATNTKAAPVASVKASEYGALCNGTNDDTAAIQAAVDAITVVAGGVESNPPYPRSAATVELPQGKCMIHSPIILSNYGSIQGSANGTWLSALEPWTATPIDNAMIEIRQSWNKALYNSQMTSSINRFVRNINFIYAAHVHSITAIKVFNQTGTTNSMPYPADDTNPQHFQIPGVIIEGVAVYSMDTAFDLEDCGECVVQNSQAFYVKNGLIDGANNYSLVVDNSAIQVGSKSYTATPTSTNGIFAASQARWVCVKGTGPSCTGGTVQRTLIASPQGLTVSKTTVEAFDVDANIGNMIGLVLNNSAFDLGAYTSGVPNPTILLGDINWTIITDCFIASSRTDSNIVEIRAATSVPTDASNLDGTWIVDSWIQAYTPAKASGIQFDSGPYARRNVYVERVQFSHLVTGASILSPLTYSVLRDNYGFDMSGQLLYLNAPGTGSFQSTFVDGNTTADSVKVVNVVAGTGLVYGYNQSPAQFLGTQVVQAPGCSFAAGAIGNHCTARITFSSAGGFPMTSSSYKPICTIQDTAVDGNVALGAVTDLTTTSLTVTEIALSTATTGGGTINCSLTQNK